mgnify:CR=1 FL=1
MKLTTYQFNLPLQHTFTIRHESRKAQPTVIVRLEDANGYEGYGEATVTLYYGVTMEKMLGAIERIRPCLDQYVCAMRTLDDFG